MSHSLRLQSKRQPALSKPGHNAGNTTPPTRGSQRIQLVHDHPGVGLRWQPAQRVASLDVFLSDLLIRLLRCDEHTLDAELSCSSSKDVPELRRPAALLHTQLNHAGLPLVDQCKIS